MDEDGFEIERDGVVVDTVGPNVTTYVDTVAPRGTYRYVVRAFNAAGNTADSNEAVVTPPLPPAPTIRAVDPASAFSGGGANVTVVGGGFTDFAPGPNTVLFGGAPGTNVVTRTNALIDCDVPPGPPGEVDVMVTNLNGTALMPDGFTYYQWPPVLLDPELRLDTDGAGGSDSEKPSVSANGDTVYAVWEDSRNGSSDIYANSSTGGSSWQPAGRARQFQPPRLCALARSTADVRRTRRLRRLAGPAQRRGRHLLQPHRRRRPLLVA